MASSEIITTTLEHYGMPLLQSLTASVIAWIVFYLFSRGLSRLAAKGLIPSDLRRILHSLGKWLTFIILLLVILGLFGISVALGFVAVWSVLSNLLCSVLLIIFAPFRIDDEIEIQDPAAPIKVRGRVLDINLMFTSLRVLDEHAEVAEESLLRIPNNLFFQKYVRTWQGKHSQSIKSYLAQGQRHSHKKE